MLLWTLLVVFSVGALGQLEDPLLEDDIDFDLTDFDLDIAPRRVPRQVKTMLSKETKPHIQELSIKTTIISRYAFTAVYCAMLNRHSAASTGVFHFQIPADAFVSNFTMIVGGRVYQSEVRPKQRRVKQENGRQTNKEAGGARSMGQRLKATGSSR